MAGTVCFDCKQQFAKEPWANASYRASPLPEAALGAITPALTAPNAARIPNARKTPKIFSGSAGAVVTTDFFAFDDSTDYYKLQGLGQACDMGDTMVAQALQGFANIAWYSIRNISDPQIPNPDHNIEQASKEAARIYARYGGLTTAASLIATWAVIHAATGEAAARTGHKLGRLPRHRHARPETNHREGEVRCPIISSAACTAPTIRASPI